MATTTNYGWTTPDDTALVKDGASAIRTLGSSVDTTTKALNPSTTLGDIEYRSSTANTNTRLGIGSTGQVLTVAAGVPSWATVAGGGMTLINTGGTTLTGASVTISSIPATYQHLQIVVRNFEPAADQTLMMRFNGDSASRYSYFDDPGSGAFGDTQIVLGFSNDNATNQGLFIIDIFDYANTTTWKMADFLALENDPTTPTQFRFQERYGVYNQTGAISSITLLPSGGTTFTDGIAYVYGVK
jgi:hypothetical protein